MFFKTIFVVFVLCIAIFVGLDLFANPVMDFAAEHKDASWAPAVFYNLGGIAFLSLKWDLAGIVYKRALKLYPSHPDAPLAYYRIGKCFEKLGNYSRAVAFYEQFLKKYPENPMCSNIEITIKEIKDFYLSNG